MFSDQEILHRLDLDFGYWPMEAQETVRFFEGKLKESVEAARPVAARLCEEIEDLEDAGHKRLSAEEAAKHGHREGWCDSGDYDCGICEWMEQARMDLARFDEAFDQFYGIVNA